MRTPGVRRFLRQDDGAAAIEFALIAPVLLLLFVGMVNFGFRFYEQSRLNQVTRETAEASMFTQDLTVLNQTMANALADLGPSISGTPYALPVEMICQCPGQIDIPNCTATQAVSCAATGLPWARVLLIRARIDYRPLFPMLDQAETLESVLQVQVR